MVRRLWNDRKLARANTVCLRVLDIHIVMCSGVISDKNLVPISAGDIVCLSIPADVVTEVTKDVGHGSYGVLALNPLSKPPDTSTSIRRQSRILGLYCKDDCYFCTVMVVPIHLHMQHLHGPSPHVVTPF
jgi:hypothetical protein